VDPCTPLRPLCWNIQPLVCCMRPPSVPEARVDKISLAHSTSCMASRTCHFDGNSGFIQLNMELRRKWTASQTPNGRRKPELILCTRAACACHTGAARQCSRYLLWEATYCSKGSYPFWCKEVENQRCGGVRISTILHGLSIPVSAQNTAPPEVPAGSAAELVGNIQMQASCLLGVSVANKDIEYRYQD
jgi:hypothetical protein